MKIAHRIVISFLLIATIGIFLAGGLVGLFTYKQSEIALMDRTAKQLISIREIKKTQIKDYFETISSQIDTYADDKMIIDALPEFTTAYYRYHDEINKNKDHDSSIIKKYYHEVFGVEYSKINNSVLNVYNIFDKLSPTAKALQTEYIAKNKLTAPKENTLNRVDKNLSYDLVHNKYHGYIHHFLESFGYYDIFFVDLKGNVVYSVSKELDFATNLVTGPFSDSGLAMAYKQSIQNPKEIAFLDFSPYTPSYENAASFIATAVYKEGQVIGSLIFQMPVDRINDIMTHYKEWGKWGLGQTGETYLVGDDNYMRSQSRYIIEEKDELLAYFEKNNTNINNLNKIKIYSTSIGVLNVQGISTSKALAGESGFNVSNNYRGIEVFSSYAPIKILGLNWAIISEISKAEALQDTEKLFTTALNILGVVCLILLTVTLIAGIFIGRSIANPMVSMIRRINEIADIKDLTSRLDSKRNDEFDSLSVSLNHFFTETQGLLSKFSHSANELFKHSKIIDKDMSLAQETTEEQSITAKNVSQSVNQMSICVQDIAMSANKASKTVQVANHKCEDTADVAKNLGKEMSELSSCMQQVNVSIKQLEEESISISSVLDVITEIAEQTNLLALNAAIEAARAGEQGRGFAVVAEEVRTLAGKTQSSTEEIREKIERLQTETKLVVTRVSSASDVANKGISACETNGNMLNEIVEMIATLKQMNMAIATSAEKQNSETANLSENVSEIAASFVGISQKTKSTQALTNKLKNQAHSLLEQLEKYNF